MTTAIRQNRLFCPILETQAMEHQVDIRHDRQTLDRMINDPKVIFFNAS